MEIDQVADELYALPPERFVSTRTERAQQARAAGDRALATEIAQLRRPSKAAWLVNQIARTRTEALAELLTLGSMIIQAQSTLASDDLRRLTRQRLAAVDALARQAVAIAAEHDQQLGPSILTEIRQTLDAALASDQIADQVRAGRLVQPVSYSGFGPASGLPASQESASTQQPADAEPAQDGRSREQANEEIHQQLSHARDALGAVRRQLDQIEAEHAAIDTERNRQEARLAELRQSIDMVKAELIEINRRSQILNDHHQEALDREAAAQQQLARWSAALADQEASTVEDR